jgi:uncharacterized protein (TIGR02118 family)
MVKVIYVLYRTEGTTREQFTRHWIDVHLPLARKLKRMRSYTINPVTSSMEILGEVEADGFAVCVWDSMEDFEADAASPEMAATGEDAATMARHFEVYIVEEHVVI